MSETLTWVVLAVCVTQSAMLSGLNLAVFSISRLRLEAAADAGDAGAEHILALRRDGHLTLVTILLGNVAFNVLLTLLSESLLPAVGAFLFSTLAITLFGEIAPQAYFTRHALRVVAVLSPLLHFYRFLLWPVARPLGKLLDRWVGPEGISWFREAELRDVLRYHARHDENEVCRLEAIGAMNFLALDDLPLGAVGRMVEPPSIVRLPIEDAQPSLPPFERSTDDPFLRRLNAAGTTWVILVDEWDEPRWVLDANAFLREALFSDSPPDPATFCHRPLVVRDDRRPLGEMMSRFRARPKRPGGGVIEEDLILVWTPSEKRIITGSDVLDRLMWGMTG